MGAREEQVVRDFVAVFAAWSEADKIASLVSDGVVYESRVPTTPVVGRDAFRDEVIRQMSRSTVQSVEILNIASTGRVVFTERLEHFDVGTAPVVCHVNGVFEVDADGLVSAWRDYWDSADLNRQVEAGG